MSDERQLDAPVSSGIRKRQSSVLALLAFLLPIISVVFLPLANASLPSISHASLFLATVFLILIVSPVLALLSLRVEVARRRNIIMLVAGLAAVLAFSVVFYTGLYLDILGWS